eukprot:838893-Pelagomonas_calceolata.AAC.2
MTGEWGGAQEAYPNLFVSHLRMCPMPQLFLFELGLHLACNHNSTNVLIRRCAVQTTLLDTLAGRGSSSMEITGEVSIQLLMTLGCVST